MFELPTPLNILLHMNGGLSKIRSVHMYVLKGFILVVSTVRSRGKRAGFSNSGKNRALESCSNISLPLVNSLTWLALNKIFR